MTFKELQDDALERLDFDPADTTATTGTPRARVKRFINEWRRRILARPGMGRLRDVEVSLAIVAGTNEYTLSTSLVRVRDITDATTGWVLREKSLDWIRRIDPTESATGAPTHFARRSATKIVVWPKPAANATLTIDGTAALTDLTADADVTGLPLDWDWLVSLGARVNEYERLDDTRARTMRVDLEDGIKGLRYHLAQSVNDPVPQSTTQAEGTSRLGAWFPAGS